MRTQVTKSFSFEAAHQLPWHPGKCRSLHGHSYRLEISVEGPLDVHGIVVDFADLETVVQQEIVERFDHTYLNDLIDNPTAENLAADIWKRLEQVGFAPPITLCRLRLWETADSSVELAP